MFEINNNLTIKKKIVEGSVIYTIDNFYKSPGKILKYLKSNLPPLWKSEQKPSYNSIYFEDRRHDISSDEFTKVYKFLSEICDQQPWNRSDLTYTNFTRFKKCPFNNYKENYWYPHVDRGYNGIVYFNKWDFFSGTNMYEYLGPDVRDDLSNKLEHFRPWKDKKDYRLIKSIKPKYNRMVLFDGKILHGMNICNNYYLSDRWRINQVFFFQQ